MLSEREKIRQEVLKRLSGHTRNNNHSMQAANDITDWIKQKFHVEVNCPLCDAPMPVVENRIWSCEDCPAILFEFYSLKDVKQLEQYLRKGKAKNDGDSSTP